MDTAVTSASEPKHHDAPSHRARQRLRLAALPLIVVAAILSGAQKPAGASGEQPVDTGEQFLQIESVSPWVDPDGVFRVAFEPGEDLPQDSLLTYTIRQRLRSPDDDTTLREVTEDALDAGAPQRSLQAPRTVAITSLANTTSGVVLEIPIRSTAGDSERQLIPTAGIHPVELVLSNPDGTVLSERTVFLNRLPRSMPVGAEDAPASTAVQLVTALDSGPTLAPDGVAEFSTEERAMLSSAQSLLAESIDVPLTVALRPNTILGLQRSSVPADRRFVDQIASSQWQLAQQSYVRVDSAALVASGGEEFTSQLQAGGAILDAVTGRPPAGLWMLDDTIDTAAARVLRFFGVSHVLVSEDRLQVHAENPEAAVHSRTIELEGVDGMSVSTYDAELTRLILEPGVSPALGAHRALTTMMAEWFDAVADDPDAFPGVSSAIVLPTGVEPEVLAALAEPLQTQGPLRLAAPPPPTEVGGVDGSAPTATLLAEDPPDLSSVVRRTNEIRTRIAGYRSMTSPTDPTAGEWDLVNNQAPSADLTDFAARSAIWSGIDAELDDRLALIETPPTRTVVLPGRNGSIPLRFRNGLDTDVRLVMRMRSPRLAFFRKERFGRSCWLPAGIESMSRLRFKRPVPLRCASSSNHRMDRSRFPRPR